jgi:myo-inositol-1(or 4)-monophosphatase
MPDPLEFAIEIAQEAGQLLCRLYTERHTVQTKSSDIDLVTEADVASEQLIVAAIDRAFPSHRILSEEGLGDHDAFVAGSTPVWLVDPLDGTVNYAHGYPAWGVSLALSQVGQVLMAVTFDPLRGDIFWARRGQGTWCNDERLRVSDVAEMGQALVATGFAYKRATIADNNLAEFGAVMPRVQGVRRAGSAVLDLAHVASGRLDGYWEMHLNPWDWAAGSLMVEEAGGKITDMQGEPWSLLTGEIVATNSHLHTELLTNLAQAGQHR